MSKDINLRSSCDCNDQYPDHPHNDHPNPNCPVEIEVCCRVPIPKGFRLTDGTVNACIDYSSLTCIKSVLYQQVRIDNLPPTCTPNELVCNAPVGYVVRAVGGLNLAVSVPIEPASPNKAHCIGAGPTQACCAQTIPVNRIIAYTCGPNPCRDACIDVSFTANRTPVTDTCGTFVLVQVLIKLNYNGNCA